MEASEAAGQLGWALLSLKDVCQVRLKEQDVFLNIPLRFLWHSSPRAARAIADTASVGLAGESQGLVRSGQEADLDPRVVTPETKQLSHFRRCFWRRLASQATSTEEYEALRFKEDSPLAPAQVESLSRAFQLPPSNVGLAVVMNVF